MTAETQPLPGVAPLPCSDDGWSVTERPAALDAETVARLGNELLVGNGYLGYRGTLEEYAREQRVSVIVSGLYDRVGDLWREPVNLPNGGYIAVSYGGGPLHALTSDVREHEQLLDLRRAVHERATVFHAADGNEIAVRSRRFASLAAPHLLCTEYTVEARDGGTVSIATGIDADVWDINGPHLRQIAASAFGETLAVTACTHERGLPVAVAQTLLDLPSPTGAEVRASGDRIVREFEVTLAPGERLTLHMVSAYHAGLESGDPLATALASCEEARSVGYERLLRDHEERWAERWDACDVRIDGDEAAQAALRFSTYHLLSIAPTHAQNVSIPARGLSGQVYKGAIFWDTEIFMLPFFVHEFPALARNLLLYRYHTLDGARRKAQEYGFRGAFYAWESQDTGDDACTLFNVTDVFTNRPMRTYFRDKQYHISADVAYAIWDYFDVTGDDSLLLDGGAEVVYECARFFMSCTYFNTFKDRYEILDVTGPDEYHERVHNNAYTNWLAGHTFDVCLRLDAYLSSAHPEAAAALRARLGIEGDLATIREMAAKLYRPEPDPETALIPQFDGYFGLEDVSLPDLLGRKLHPHEYLGGGDGLATTTQIIKQADVVLGMYLLGERFPAAAKAANWTYYEPRTEHGSSLSACSYSLIAAEIGRSDWAYDYFMRTASIDLTGNSTQFVGPLYIGGTHPAANGGAWMSAVLGLCGVRCSGATLRIDPRLPGHWIRVELPLTFRGRRLRLTLTHDGVEVAADAGGPAIEVEVRGRRERLEDAGSLAFELSVVPE